MITLYELLELMEIFPAVSFEIQTRDKFPFIGAVLKVGTFFMIFVFYFCIAMIVQSDCVKFHTLLAESAAV